MEASFDDAYLSSSDTFLNNVYGYPNTAECGSDPYGSFTQLESCPSMSSSFLTIDTSNRSFDDTQKDPTENATQSLSSPEDFTTSGGSVNSPITPVASQPNNQWYSLEPWEGSLQRDLWPQDGSDHGNPWLSMAETMIGSCIIGDISQLQSFDGSATKRFSPAQYSNHDPNISLARAIFSSPSITNAGKEADTTLWPQHSLPSHPETIEPCRILQTMIPSSPCTKLESVTPLKRMRSGSALYCSSPMSKISSSVLASQWDADENKYFSPPTLPAYEEQDDDLDSSNSSPVKRPRYSGKSAACLGKSGMNCDPVIPLNSFACSWPGCVDKHTGRPKMFKRQEHMKRHVRSVHEKGDMFVCWVCSKAFTRRDNLKSHQFKTHGRRTDRGNAYVATLDVNSKYFDKAWEGQLNSDGLPVGHPEHPEVE